ncbi:LysE family translocator [Nocardia farcinica]|uniref:LysE family translocator n=1 Tax=Nocardia farcinica TaxID=37329 RepID=UPI002457AFB6|nr:LysE family translocator [Nocardia farcinica]
MSTEFVLTTLVVVATPGTGALFTLATALSRGARAGLVAALGCTLGIVPHLLAAITGLAALLHTSALAFQTVKYLGVAYLLYMAWSVVRDTGSPALPTGEPATGTRRSAARVVGAAVLLNLLNPKLTVFFVAFLPQFVPAGTPRASLRMLELGAVFMLATFVVFAAYGICAATLRGRVLHRPAVLAWTRRTFAVSFLAMAGRLAVQDPGAPAPPPAAPPALPPAAPRPPRGPAARIRRVSPRSAGPRWWPGRRSRRRASRPWPVSIRRPPRR